MKKSKSTKTTYGQRNNDLSAAGCSGAASKPTAPVRCSGAPLKGGATALHLQQLVSVHPAPLHENKPPSSGFFFRLPCHTQFRRASTRFASKHRTKRENLKMIVTETLDFLNPDIVSGTSKRSSRGNGPPLAGALR